MPGSILSRSFLASAGEKTGVAPFVTTCFGPRTAAAGGGPDRGSPAPRRAPSGGSGRPARPARRRSEVTTMDTQRLKTLYEDQLAADLRPPVAQSVKRRETGAILRASCATPGGELREVRHAAVWLWSDLHLGAVGEGRLHRLAVDPDDAAEAGV